MRNHATITLKATIRLAALACLAVSISVPAYGYIDPGTGSLLIQGVIGAIAAVAVTLKVYWHKVRVFFSSTPSDSQAESQAEDSTSQSE